MGNKVNKNEFYVYARKENNKWDHTLYSFPPNEDNAISIFKHLVIVVVVCFCCLLLFF